MMIQEELPSKRISNAILRKGLINLFPTKVKDLVMNNYRGEIEDRIQFESLDEVEQENFENDQQQIHEEQRVFARSMIDQKFMSRNQAAAPPSQREESKHEEMNRDEMFELERPLQNIVYQAVQNKIQHSVWDKLHVYHQKLEDDKKNPKTAKPELKLMKRINMKTLALKSIFGKITEPQIALSSSIGLFLLILAFFLF